MAPENVRSVMPLVDKVHIVGIGDDGVDGMTAHARRLVEAAEVLLGPESCVAMLPTVKPPPWK